MPTVSKKRWEFSHSNLISDRKFNCFEFHSQFLLDACKSLADDVTFQVCVYSFTWGDSTLPRTLLGTQIDCFYGASQINS